jgi:succinate dehydrogenase/fumarate reductase flavoprotein subunit
MKEWKGISRRDFLKGAAAGAVGVAAVGVLGGCSPSESNSDEAKSYNVSETKSADIVVVGSGASGICATVQAAELGAQVILLESNSVLGGNGILTEGMLAIGSSLQKASGVGTDITFREVIATEQEFFNYRVNALFWKDLVENSADNLEWLIKNGV